MREPGRLVRIVRVGEDQLAIGRTLAGRGAWLCADNPSCGARAARRGAFSRAFRAPVSAAAVQRLLGTLPAGGSDSA